MCLASSQVCNVPESCERGSVDTGSRTLMQAATYVLLSNIIHESRMHIGVTPCNSGRRVMVCRLMTVANYAMKLEREVWGILDGPWGSDTWMGWRRDWAQRVTSLAFLPF